MRMDGLLLSVEAAADGRRLGGLLVVALSLLASPASANECNALVDTLIARMRQAVPVIGIEENKGEQQGWRSVNISHPMMRRAGDHPAKVNLTCNPVHPPVLLAQWDHSPPPAAFYDLVGQLGAIVVGLPAASVRETAKAACRVQAQRSDHFGIIVRDGVKIDCQPATKEGGVLVNIGRNSRN